MLRVFGVLLIRVVGRLMGGLLNVLGFEEMYKGVEYEIKE